MFIDSGLHRVFAAPEERNVLRVYSGAGTFRSSGAEAVGWPVVAIDISAPTELPAVPRLDIELPCQVAARSKSAI